MAKDDSAFFGIQEAKLDGQYRLPLIRDVIEARGTKDDLRVVPDPKGRYIDIFILPTFNRYYKNFIQRQDISSQEREAAINGYFSRAQLANVDSTNRMTVPKPFRDLFKGAKRVIMQGRGPMMRVMPASEWPPIEQESTKKVVPLMSKIEDSAYIVNNDETTNTKEV